MRTTCLGCANNTHGDTQGESFLLSRLSCMWRGPVGSLRRAEKIVDVLQFLSIVLKVVPFMHSDRDLQAFHYMVLTRKKPPVVRVEDYGEKRNDIGGPSRTPVVSSESTRATSNVRHARRAAYPTGLRKQYNRNCSW